MHYWPLHLCLFALAWCSLWNTFENNPYIEKLPSKSRLPDIVPVQVNLVFLEDGISPDDAIIQFSLSREAFKYERTFAEAFAGELKKKFPMLRNIKFSFGSCPNFERAVAPYYYRSTVFDESPRLTFQYSLSTGRFPVIVSDATPGEVACADWEYRMQDKIKTSLETLHSRMPDMVEIAKLLELDEVLDTFKAKVELKDDGNSRFFLYNQHQENENRLAFTQLLLFSAQFAMKLTQLQTIWSLNQEICTIIEQLLALPIEKVTYEDVLKLRQAIERQ